MSEPHSDSSPAANPPPTVVIQSNSGAILMYRLMALTGWMGFAFCGLWALGQMIAFAGYFDTSQGITEAYHSGAKFASAKVAIINVSGVILDGDGYVKRQIDRIRDDDDVKAVVVRVNSPGGTITGSDYIYHHLRRLRKEKNLPMVVSMGSIAASGGYYVAMAVGDQEDCIFAEPTTTTGSIGVIVPHYDISGLMERFDVKDDSIASHPRKQMLSMTRPLREEDRALVEDYVNAAFERFKTIVQSGRPQFREDTTALEKLATGEVFTADQAIESGLVDQIGFVEEAIERAMALANLDEDSARVIEYEGPISLFDLVAVQTPQPVNQLSAMLEMTVPRGYYLYTTLPPLMTTW